MVVAGPESRSIVTDVTRRTDAESSGAGCVDPSARSHCNCRRIGNRLLDDSPLHARGAEKENRAEYRCPTATFADATCSTAVYPPVV
jgi:hypothetical protein